MTMLDSRELVERLNELRELKGVAEDLELEDNTDIEQVKDVIGKMNGFTDEQQAELVKLEAVIEEIGEDYAEDGVTLIPESEFVEYTADFCRDCGYIDRNFPSWIEIDWDATADNLKQDYYEVTFNGTDYLYQV